MVRNKLFIIISFALISLFACKVEEASPDIVSNQECIIKYNNDLELLVISVSSSGSYDSQNIYIPKTDLNGFNEGDLVLFSGEITRYDSRSLKVFVGHEFYHISLSDIKVAD
ncbi:MAG: hypothetical protein RLO17_17090 [Cyclobacteriaceae bacterium]